MSNSNDQTISTPETREREVVALKHQVRDMANERNKAEQDVRDLRAEVEGLKARDRSQFLRIDLLLLEQSRLTAQLAQVERERDHCKVIAMRCDAGIRDKIGEVLQLQQQLASSEARVKELEAQVNQATDIIAALTPLSVVTESDLKWAHDFLAQAKAIAAPEEKP